ncbi:MAG: dicarboxylate/amino acid:cation symporter [Pirellulaceae bacterium]|jgi:DAACS family dicarboxylate/amino acid:cation (Na+ or H+) symporter|nr:dicarboxylate/amino acid:cation symporter [Pirellulaceae bacterium]
MSSSHESPQVDPPPARRGGVPLHTRILVGLLLGLAAGLAAHAWYARPEAGAVADQRDQDINGVDDRLDWVALNVADPVGRVFLRLVLMVVLPLIISALALAVIEIGDFRRLGSVGLKTLLLTLLLSGMAVTIGVVLVNTLRPGERLSAEKRNALAAQYASNAADSVAQSRQAKSLKDTLLDIIPQNPLQEMVGALDGSSPGNGILAVMFFALVFGAAIARVGRPAATLVQVLEGTYAASMQVIDWAMQLAPLGVACLVFAMAARLGGEVFVTLIWFLAAVMLGFAIQLGLVYPLVLVLAGRVRPWAFFRAIESAMLTAFATSSSSATLPVALRVAEERLRLPPAIARFVLTIGATGNQNGTALYEGVVVLFLAQVFGVDLSLGQQITVVLLSVLAGVGTAGVPGGSIPMIVLVLQSIGVPGESIAIILGIDRICDMCRTTLNVTGDLVLATCVSDT